MYAQWSKGEAYLLHGEPEYARKDCPFILLDCRIFSKYLCEGDNWLLLILNGILITSHLTDFPLKLVLASCIVTRANSAGVWAPVGSVQWLRNNYQISRYLKCFSFLVCHEWRRRKAFENPPLEPFTGTGRSSLPYLVLGKASSKPPSRPHMYSHSTAVTAPGKSENNQVLTAWCFWIRDPVLWFV